MVRDKYHRSQALCSAPGSRTIRRPSGPCLIVVPRVNFLISLPDFPLRYSHWIITSGTIRRSSGKIALPAQNFGLFYFFSYRTDTCLPSHYTRLYYNSRQIVKFILPKNTDGCCITCMIDTSSRTIKSFEPDPDVLRMLERAKDEDGISFSHVLNNAAREWLTKKGYARKRELSKQAA